MTYMCSIEIVKLKEKNNSLIQELKRLNSTLDIKMMSVNLSKPEQVTSEMEEAKMLHELECLNKMGAMYEKEIEQLKAKLQIKAGPDRVIELERQIGESKQAYEKNQKRIRDMQKKIKDIEKALEKAGSIKASDSEQYEVLG